MSRYPLNPQQQRAVEHQGSPLCILAGAGSGKTSVMTRRVAHLIGHHQVEPARCCLVTFTNKAAREMTERMEPLVGRARTRAIVAGTFHSLCVRFLRPVAALYGRSAKFTVYDDSDQETVAKKALDELGLDKKFWAAGAVVARIGKAKQEAFTPTTVPTIDVLDEQFVAIWERYESWLQSCDAFDFQDLILYGMRLAESQRPEGLALRSRFDEVLVDEFQDTDGCQFRLVQALASKTRHLCVVGDDDQTIYTWRGARVEHLRQFKDVHYPDAEVIKLEQNYRSTKHVVGAAVGVIAASTLRVPKTLWTANPDGALVKVVSCPSDRDEGLVVVGRIKALVQGGTLPASIAVLYRSHVQSRPIEDALRDAGMPYTLIGGHRFYDRAEVKDILSYLRLIVNSKSNVDLLRILNQPPRGIGSTTTKLLGEIAGSKAVPLFHGILPTLLHGGVDKRAKSALGNFRTVIEGFQQTVKTGAPHEFVARLIEATGYRKMWLDEADEKARLGKKAEADVARQRAANADEVINAVRAYEARATAAGDTPSVEGYVQNVTLAMAIDDDPKAARVTLMTVHASKGLEYEAIFLVGFEDGRFPSSSGGNTDPLELEEERRLCYVAFTRAKKELVITHADERYVRGKPEYASPSRFLVDVPPEHMERFTVEEWNRSTAEALLRARRQPAQTGAPS